MALATSELVRHLDRYPFNSQWVRGLIGRYGLPLWFSLITLSTLYRSLTATPELFFDAKLYVDATREWLGGGDPWSVELWGIYFAAPPPTLIPLIPFALMPAEIGWVTLGVACVGAAFLTLRLLELPWWWLLFPPMATGMVSGNLQVLLIPLILGGAGWLAGFLKVYGIVPDLVHGHWRQVAIFGFLLIASAPFLPWVLFLANLGAIGDSLAAQSHFGPTLLVSAVFSLPALLAMRIVGRERSAWLVVPALWPAQQWYYATLVLPARSRLVAFVISLPFGWSGLAALFALAAVTYWKRRRDPATVSDSAPAGGRLFTDQKA